MVSKTTFTVTVLHDGEEPVQNMELEAVMAQMDSGDMIGEVEAGETVPIPADKLKEELEAIGNDGTFFGLCDDEEDQEDPEP